MMKNIRQYIQEKYLIGKDTIDILYLIYPTDDDYDIINDLTNIYKVITYFDEETQKTYDIFILTKSQLDPIKCKLSINKCTFIWKLSQDFDIDKFEKWFSDPKRMWWETEEIVKKINKKYRLEQINEGIK